MSTNPVGWLYGLRLQDSEEYRYIGITTQGVDVRFAQHLKAARYPSKKTNYPVYHWIRKHGEESIAVDAISCHFSFDELSKEEMKLIAELRASGVNLLNISEGGVIFRQTPEMREKVRQSKLGRPNPAAKGVVVTDSVREKMRASAAARWSKPEEREKARQAALRRRNP